MIKQEKKDLDKVTGGVPVGDKIWDEKIAEIARLAPKDITSEEKALIDKIISGASYVYGSNPNTAYRDLDVAIAHMHQFATIRAKAEREKAGLL